QTRRQRRGTRAPVDETHGVGAARAEAAFVVMRQEFGLVSGQVDIDRALALTALAGEAKVERLLYVFVLPTPVKRAALQHLKEQVGAAARRVPLLLRHLVARAHDPAALA